MWALSGNSVGRSQLRMYKGRRHNILNTIIWGRAYLSPAVCWLIRGGQIDLNFHACSSQFRRVLVGIPAETRWASDGYSNPQKDRKVKSHFNGWRVFSPPARWGLLDFNIALRAFSSPLLSSPLLSSPLPIASSPPRKLLIAVGTARSQLPAPASSRSQWAPLDLNKHLPISVSTADLNRWTSTGDLEASDLEASGHRWTWTGGLSSPVGTTGLQPPDRMLEYMPSRMPDYRMPERMLEYICQNKCNIYIYQIVCKKKCQIECQIECQNICQIDCRIQCQNICQTGCQNIFQIECQNICQVECKTKMSDRMPDRMRDRMPERMPDRMSEYMSDKLPDTMPEHMSDRMSEYIPDGMSEYMSDKLTEYIEYMSKYTSWNVMVGITRSKGFFLGGICISMIGFLHMGCRSKCGNPGRLLIGLLGSPVSPSRVKGFRSWSSGWCLIEVLTLFSRAFSCKFCVKWKSALVRCPCAFRLHGPAQSLRHRLAYFGRRHFTCKFSH